MSAGLRQAIRLCMAVGLLWLLWRLNLLSFTNLAVLWAAPGMLAGALALAWLTIPMAALRWQTLLHCQSIHIPFGKALMYTWLGVFMNNYMPASLGADVSRAACLFRQRPDAKARAVMSLVADRVVTLLGVLLTAWAFGLWLTTWHTASGFLGQAMGWMFGLVALCGTVTLYYVLRPGSHSMTVWLERKFGETRLGGKIVDMLHLLRIYMAAPGPVLLAVCLSIANQLAMATSLSILAAGMGYPMLTLDVLGLSTPLTLIANMLPVSPGGIGVGEAAFANINMWLLPGEALAGAGSVFLGFRLVTLVISLPGVFSIVGKSTAAKEQEII